MEPDNPPAITGRTFQTGCLRRLLLDRCQLRVLCNFDNERRIFPGIDNRQDFDIVVFEKGGSTAHFDAAFLTRETERAIQGFRSHHSHLVLDVAAIRQLSPQTLTLFEFRSQRDIALIQKAYQLHPAFGDGVMSRLGLKYRQEFNMRTRSYLFRTREWLRQHGCSPERGEQWRAASADWYLTRDYVERPIAQWYVLFEGDKVIAHSVPWPIKSSKSIRESDLDDFNIRLTLPNRQRFFGRTPDDSGHPSVFIPSNEARTTDLPAYIAGAKKLKEFSFGPAIRPNDVFVPLIEGKWIYLFDHQAFAYVSGAGSWVVSRHTTASKRELIPHYFMARLDSAIRTEGSGPAAFKVGVRDVAKTSDERTVISAAIPSFLPCNNKVPTFSSKSASDDDIFAVTAWMGSFVSDFFGRLGTGNQTLLAIKRRPAPVDGLIGNDELSRLVHSLLHVAGKSEPSDQAFETADRARALIDAVIAELFELTPYEYAYILSTFPLLDRDQPPLPHDYRIRATNKGVEWRKISFITRDLALLTYCDYLAGRLDVQPDSDRVRRICPNGVPEPPTNLIEFFAAAGVDISGQTEHAVAATGPLVNLRDRVTRARELGAIAYIPTIDRRRATFVERAATAGGLTPEEGVLTPEMAQHVLREKATRDAKWAKAMELWDATPDPRAATAASTLTDS